MGLCFSKKDVLGRRPLSLREQILSDLTHDKVFIIDGNRSPSNSTATTMTTTASSFGGRDGEAYRQSGARERWRDNKRRVVAGDEATATATSGCGSSSSPLVQAIDATYGMDNVAKSYAHFHRRRRLLEIDEDDEIDGQQQGVGLAKKTLRRSLHVFGDDSEDERRWKSKLGGSSGMSRNAGGSRWKSGFESTEEEDEEDTFSYGYRRVYGYGYDKPSFVHRSYFSGRCSFSTDEVSTTTTYATDSGDETASRRPPSSTSVLFGRSSWSPSMSYEKRIFADGEEFDGDESDESDDLFEIANLESAVLSSLSSSTEQEFSSTTAATLFKDPGISRSIEPVRAPRQGSSWSRELPSCKTSVPALGRTLHR